MTQGRTRAREIVCGGCEGDGRRGMARGRVCARGEEGEGDQHRDGPTSVFWAVTGEGPAYMPLVDTVSLAAGTSSAENSTPPEHAWCSANSACEAYSPCVGVDGLLCNEESGTGKVLMD